MNSRSFLYIRVSTKQQARSRESIMAQHAALREYGLTNNSRQCQVHVDAGVSGSVPFDGRPEGKKILNEIRAGDEIVVTTLDRLFRDPLDGLLVAKELEEIGATIRTLDAGAIELSTAMSRYQYVNALALSQLEYGKARERTASVKRHQRDSNAYMGGNVPFGKRVVETVNGRALVDDEDEQKVITYIMGAHQRGWSARYIAACIHKELNHEISYRSVARIIQREKEDDNRK